MLIMASVIRVGQSKFVTVPIDEDSSERIMNCIETLSNLQDKPVVHELFLKDTKSAYGKMLSAQEKKAAEKKEQESTKPAAIQVDDLLTFRQFSKKAAEDIVDVSDSVSTYVYMRLICTCPRRIRKTWFARLEPEMRAKTSSPISAAFLSSLVSAVASMNGTLP
jgi:vesicle coat complex subunit